VYVLSSGKEFALIRGNLADFLTLPASSASARNLDPHLPASLPSCPQLRCKSARNTPLVFSYLRNSIRYWKTGYAKVFRA
jgi:hypothetical protein